MTHNQNDPHHDSRDGDPVYHEAPPADSGSASSFDTRHNEFPPGAGHDGAAIDPKTGKPVHGDGTPVEAPSHAWPTGPDAEQPEQVDGEERVELEQEQSHWSEDNAPRDQH
ncbi:hypothetical protein D8Y24_02815 [Agrococcus lahaulensis]|uniref:hypothetical protein n=1 Tax=Agrococcus sp. BE272 TaxID=2817727 RepID=UPI000FE3B0AC|nr:hypothetical protein [Agrococcus sp. BE272]MDR7234168.1 hypothetical protein [Agrococcus sp. BE272]RWR25236.1 hypothetical protein D8Y24_02815 [Agrococcus lahaulensis]